MPKKITIKDIAREAGVSVATVSYVVNNRTDMRISEKTRKKVLQIINLLGYTPNQSAQALATSRTRMIAFAAAADQSVFRNAEQFHFASVLTAFLQRQGYDLIHLNSGYHEKFDRADAIICYDLSSECFLAIGDANFIPLLAFDCIVNDPLFFQINSDYAAIKANADAHFGGEDYILCLLDTPNRERQALIEQLFPHIRYIHTLSDAAQLMPECSPAQNLLVLEHSLYELFSSHPKLFYQPLLTEAKLEALMLCLTDALSHVPERPHDIIV